MEIRFTKLAECVADVERAARDTDRGPGVPVQFAPLKRELQDASRKLSPTYKEILGEPLIRHVDSLGAVGLRDLLRDDPAREGDGGLILDLSQAVIQRGSGFQPREVGALQEVISDLYDGFLSAEDRAGVKPPDHSTAAPAVKFGEPDSGPYTWPADATAALEIQCSVVSVPPANARGGLLTWSTLGHETAGHDILSADIGLAAEVTRSVRKALTAARVGDALTRYWTSRIDETAADVLGVLNMGPAAAIGLIGFLRGFNASMGDGPVLSREGPVDDAHPADLIRGFLVSHSVRLLDFTAAGKWADAIDEDLATDEAPLELAGHRVTAATARRSAKVVAEAVARTQFRSLEEFSFADIQNWRDSDEVMTNDLADRLAGGAIQDPPGGTYAAHAVAGGVVAAVTGLASVGDLFPRMIAMVHAMHKKNPVFGPLRVRHRSDVHRHFFHSRFRRFRRGRAIGANA
ncbi:MAG: hypothetical protein FJW39_04235 [Acidobacteria bacterium]|nr:hypothetical protein [Acidobacteriota bacterium]